MKQLPVLVVALAPGVAHAYIGPGAAASASGVALAVLAAIGLVLAALVIRPLRAAMPAARKAGRRGAKDAQAAGK